MRSEGLGLGFLLVSRVRDLTSDFSMAMAMAMASW
jgi:hypothetical protein